MKRAVALLAMLIYATALAVAERAKASDILANPGQFHNRHLTVSGLVAKYKAKTSRIGKTYFTFDLVDGKARIAVYGRGELTITPRNGDRVDATGLFASEREAAGVVYRNELDLTSNGDDGHGLVILR